VQFSGVVVVSAPVDITEVSARLEAMPGVEVYAHHAESGRIVVVQEAADLDVHESRLRAIQALPGVLAAELVYHVADPGPDLDAPGDSGSAEPCGGTAR
jgi:nitrate reductase NapD